MKSDPRRSKTPVTLDAIGAALKEERLLLGMTQTQAAKQFEISLKALRNLEQGIGSVTLSTATQILEYFGRELRVGDIVSSPRPASLPRPRRADVLETLSLIRPVLEKKFDVKTIALFGSCARDEAKKDSDIDLAVEFKTPPTFRIIGKVTTFLETMFDGHKVDLVEMDKLVPTVRENAERDFIYVP